ncbi:MAG TPA: rhodanese-like domain-containing protein [Rhodocyclaceae bacterium]|nr:rhodanese-like domain-containing protein [Rhodocyclaceae bacterium]
MRNIARSMFASCGFALAVLAAGGAYANTPASLDGTNLVTADKVKALLDGGTAVIDTRVAQEYAEGHIKGAKSVPYKEKSAKAADFDAAQDSFDLGKLPADKNAEIVFYCNGPECWKSYKASKAALKAGYKKVDWFRGGFPEWKSKGFQVE